MNPSLIAVDIGNSFLHLARYAVSDRDAAAAPRGIAWDGDDGPRVLRLAGLPDAWPCSLPEERVDWFVVAVHRAREQALRDWVRDHRPGDTYCRLGHADFGLQLAVRQPDRVGCDRVAAARAAYALREQAGAAIVVDLGSAVTVDLVDAERVFQGGAIFPGRYMMADALHRHTDALPLVSAPATPPAVPGSDTESAIQSGIYWGTVGAVRELVAHLRRHSGAPCELFVTGGGQAQDLPSDLQPRYVSDLVLRGAAWAAHDIRHRATAP
jgi:type III pantothenate kinase